MGLVTCCWGNPDKIYYTVEGEEKPRSMNLGEDGCYPVGFFSGRLHLGQEYLSPARKFWCYNWSYIQALNTASRD